MDSLWIAIGCLILVLTFLDTFLAVLNYDEAGILVNRLVRWQWILLRSFTRRVSRRRRPMVLRQVTGVLILTTILGWIIGIVLGFTFIYLGLIGLGAFQLSKGVDADFVGALYLSFGQFATVGADNVSPGGGWVNLIPVLEALLSVVLLSFIIAFLSNVYGVIQSLRSLCADFFSTGDGVGSPVDALQPYFPDGEARDIDRHLDELIDDFNLYCDGLRQDHSAYYFQSGDDQFSLPFALHMTAGVVSALRWGLPTGHDATRAPSLLRLIDAFDDFRERRYEVMKWQSPAAPTPMVREEFERQLGIFHTSGSRRDLDPWALRFFVLNDAMAATIRATGPVDVDDAYLRYVQWLPFTHHALQFTAEVGRDLDYQPIYRGISDAPDVSPIGAASDAENGSSSTGAPPTPTRRRAGGMAAWMLRRHLFLDPGYVRLWTALRTLAAVTVAITASALASTLIGWDPVPAGVFAGLIALFADPSSSGWGAGLMRGAGFYAVIPVAAGIAIGALLPRNEIVSIVELAIVAAVSVWLGRFGPRMASFGRLAFIANYFALLVAVGTSELIGAIVAAAIGVLCSWLASILPQPSARRQVRDGVDAINERTALLLDSATDVVSAIGGKATVRALRRELVALRRTAMGLTWVLDPESPPDGLSPERVHALRLHVFDVELAAENLTQTLPEASDYAVTVDQRAVLAGELTALQRQTRVLRDSSREPAPTASAGTSSARHTSEAWPIEAARLHAAIDELSTALRSLHDLIRSDEAVPVDPQQRTAAESKAPSPAIRRAQSTKEQASAIDRRAVQSGLSTGIALVIGSFVSTSHQIWAAMPAFQTLSESDGETRVRSLQRILGTVAGAAVAFGLALWTGHNLMIAVAVVAISVFLMSFVRLVASSWTSFWQTVLLATMYDVLGTLDAEAVEIRVLETVIGAGVAILVSALVLRTRTRTRVRRAMSDVVSSAANVVHNAFQTRTGAGLGRDADAADERAVMNRRFQDFQAITQPLRHDPGVLQRGGIEVQLNSLTALLYYTRHLTKTLSATSSSAMPTELWRRVESATSDNFASTLAVLSDRVPPRVHEVKELTAAPAGATDTDRLALVEVERINQSLLAYMAAVKPGSTGEGPAG